MTASHVTDETLMSLADGELPAAQSAQLRQRIERDPVLAARFALFAETRALAQEEPAQGAASGADPLARRILELAARIDAERTPAEPPRLRVLTAEAPPPTVGRAASARPRPARWGLALAASIVLAIGAVGGHLATRMVGAEGSPVALAVPVPPAELQLALDTMRSDERHAWSGSGGGALTLLATHRIAGGAICREFDVVTRAQADIAVLAVACRLDGRWETRLAIARPVGGASFTPASGPGAAAEHYLAEIGSTGALGNEEERALIRDRWR
jgi:hypothetical protein